MFATEIIHLQLSGAIKDTEEMASLPFDKDSIQSFLENYSDVFEALKASIGYLPVPLEITHSRNHCDFFEIYKGFEELSRLYSVNRICENGISELQQIEAIQAEKSKMRKWLSKFLMASVEVHFLPQKTENFLPFSFRTGINILIPFNDLRNIFELNKVYERVRKQNPNILVEMD